MKTRLTFITSLLLSLLLFSGCHSESTSEGLEDEVKEIQRLEEQSKNIKNTEDAFKMLRDLNQNMKSIRDKILGIEIKYREASQAEKKKLENDFEEANAKIDKSLKIISENIEPYKDKEQVSKMLDKLNEILISK